VDKVDAVDKVDKVDKVDAVSWKNIILISVESFPYENNNF
jgi:hypothetical protein